MFSSNPATDLVITIGKELHGVDDVVEAESSNELSRLQVLMHRPHITLEQLESCGGGSSKVKF